ncbi:MAG: hypothetical protein E7333_07970 [Clostridiales bacterium]|nr:hypothetical protein [Clostridiales bacterium]
MLHQMTARTLSQLTLGAGVFLSDFPLTATSLEQLREQVAQAIQDPQKYLGQTTGKGEFRCVPQIRSLGEAGQRTPTPWDTLVDGWTVTLSGTLTSSGAESFLRLLPGWEEETAGRITTLTCPGCVPFPMKDVCWVGDTSAGLACIHLHQALHLKGAALTLMDQGAATLPFSFQVRHMGTDLPLPVTVAFFS